MTTIMDDDVYRTQPRYVHINGANVSITHSDGDPSTLPRDEESRQLQDATYLVHEGSWYQNPGQRRYVLKEFPYGYKLYTHRKGERSNPRLDHYLYGSTSNHCQKFRSPEEFVLHAKWLAYGGPKDPYDDHPRCGCRYCSKTPQSEIARMLKKKTRHLGSQPGLNLTKVKRRDGRRREEGAAITAKDYTNIDRGKGVTKWTESTPLST
ncbi:hypothetical protein DFH11DRAFT_432085 [Phellopilus nigrolimitatus]|nr:hypothetical protein DFH11DRAFT_432085 [Phellopilus nigrolimitatus]